jgi:transposase
MYPLDIRKQALKIYSKVQSLRKTSKLLDIHFSSISRWLHQLERKPYPERKYTKEALIVETIKDVLQTNPLTSSRLLQQKLKDAFRVDLSRELVRVAIKKLGYTRKKARFVSEPKTNQVKIEEFLKQRESLKDRTFFSIDETSFGRHSFKTTGYSPKGKKLYITKKQPRMTSVSVCACASKTGWIKVSKVEGSFNKTSFLTFLQQLSLPPTSVLLLDNVKFHHSKDVKDYLEKIEVFPLYTPPYSPWFNPIEGCFSIVKRSFADNQNITKSFDSLNVGHFEAFFIKSLTATQKW